MIEIPSFELAVRECFSNQEFMHHYRRLTKSRLGKSVSAIEAMIDKATGFEDKEYHDFFVFVRDYVWLPVLRECAKDMK